MELLRNMIRQGKWNKGEKLPTEQFLVTKLSVSRGTVRKALRILEDQGVIGELRGDMGKTRARYVVDPKAGSSFLDRSIVLLTNVEAVLDDPAASFGGHGVHAVGAAIVRAARKNGYHFIHVNSAMVDAGDVEELVACMSAGVLAEQTAILPEMGAMIVDRMVETGVPAVVEGSDPRFAKCDRVDSDHQAGGYELTKWLIGRGCRRIVQAGCCPEETCWVKLRSAGYRKALQEAGLPVLPRVHLKIDRVKNSQAEYLNVVRHVMGFLFEHLTGPNRVDAIMAQNDCDALLILSAIRLAGLRPNVDIAVVGYDNMALDMTCPWEDLRPIATVDKKNIAVGEEMMTLFQDRIEGRLSGPPVVRLIQPELVVLPQKA